MTMRQSNPAGHSGPGSEWDARPALRQMSLAAWFSTFAERHDDLDLVAHEACKVAAVGARARFSVLLQFRADQQAFMVQAGTGWQGAGVGCVWHTADLTTTAGLALRTGQLIHFRGLRPGGRVRAVGPMQARGVQSVLSLPILGAAREGFGVLEVGRTETQEFTRHDASFLQALAHSLAAAVGRHAAVARGHDGHGVLAQRGAGS